MTEPRVPSSSGPEGSLWPVVLVAAGLFPLLAALRHLDDNSLASWEWVLEGRDAVGLWVLHLAVVAAAVLASRLALTRRGRLPAIAAAAFLAGLAPALLGEPEGVVDAARYFAQAKYLELHGLRAFLAAWGGEVHAWTDLPLPALFFGALFRAFGELRIVAQVAAAGLLALTAVATARAGALLAGREAGERAALLLPAAPVLLLNTPLLMGDVLTTCALALTAWGLLAAAERGSAGPVLLGGVAVGAGLLAKYSTWTLLAALCATVAAREAIRGRWRGVLRVAAAAGLGGAFLLAFVAAHPDLVARQLALLSSFQWEGLRRWSESHTSTFLFQVHPLLAGAALAGLWRGARQRDAGVLVLAAVPLALLVLGARRSRYLLPALPFIALLAARGLEAVGSSRRRFLVVWAAGFSLVTVLVLQVPFLRWTNTANLAAAGSFLDGAEVAAVRVWVEPTPGVLMNPEVAIPLLDYHSGATVVAAGATPQRPGEDELSTSSLRFTWETPLPAWYRETRPPGRTALVLVAGDPDAPPPPDLVAVAGIRPPDAVFWRDAVYRWRALVSVWLAE